MSITNFTTRLLNLKDPNITISDEISYIVKKNITYTLLNGKLTYIPEFCPLCGCVNKNHSIIKHGSKSSDIKLLPCNGNPAILRLKKQRFLCNDCNSTFSAKTFLVDYACYISNQVKSHILVALKLKASEKDIAFNHYVSHSTVSRLIDSSFTNYLPNINYLPRNLMFDEFKSTKSAKGAMSFIFADSDNGNIVDIVENRQLYSLKKYFYQYDIKARKSVRTICIDMYSPYITLVKELFPNAKIIIDRFHIVQLVNRAFQKARIDTMKKYKTNSNNYKRLKKYWKLLSKDKFDLDGIEFKRKTHFKFWVSEKTLVKETISCDPILKATYDAYQTLLRDVKRKDKTLMIKHLKEFSKKDDIHANMITAIETLIKYTDYISNSLDYEYSNGKLEGINNYIKTIKRIAFGYKSFFHFRNRILISKNLIHPIKNIG